MMMSVKRYRPEAEQIIRFAKYAGAEVSKMELEDKILTTCLFASGKRYYHEQDVPVNYVRYTLDLDHCLQITVIWDNGKKHFYIMQESDVE